MSARAAVAGPVAALGRWTLGIWRDLMGIGRLFKDSLRHLDDLEARLVFRQAYELANGSIFFVSVVMAFTGAIMVIQASAQAQRILGDLSPIGPAFLELVLREFGPTISALMVATRYGAAVGAELGAMKVTEQVDALRMTGSSPEGYLVAPRLVAGLIGIVPVVVLGSGVAYLAGGVAGHYGFGIGWDTYFSLSLVGAHDVVLALAKAMAFGLAVPLVSCFAGLSARGGAPGVGRSATYSVIGSSTAILFLDLIIGVAGHLVESLA